MEGSSAKRLVEGIEGGSNRSNSSEMFGSS
jgi:hypothetical protein